MTRIRRLIIGYIIGGHVMAVVGCYLIAKGIIANIFTPLFTGLMLIMGAGCLFSNAVGMSVKPKVNWIKELIKDWAKKKTPKISYI